jgi:hypothetical protein
MSLMTFCYTSVPLKCLIFPSKGPWKMLEWSSCMNHPQHPVCTWLLFRIWSAGEGCSQWQHPARLVAVKSHAGRVMSERADEAAEHGHGECVQGACSESAPENLKYGSPCQWPNAQLLVRVRVLAAQRQEPLPGDSAPDQSLLQKVAPLRELGLTSVVRSAGAAPPLSDSPLTKEWRGAGPLQAQCRVRQASVQVRRANPAT